MLPTSGAYNFQSIPIDLIIREGFENIGITGDFVEPQKLESAKTSLNLLLLDWINRGVKLWTLKTDYLSLITNQGKYTLANYVNNMTQVNLRTSVRQLNGVAAASGGGVAANAFDGNPATFCDAGVNGNISYDYGVNVTQQINFVGIQSNATSIYTLLVEVSQDDINWLLLYAIPTQTFEAGVIVWFDIPAPILARAYRIREIGGSNLRIQELYFNNTIFDTPMSAVSKYEYLTYPYKAQSGTPSVYYLDRQYSAPILTIWPTPLANYNCIQYTYEKKMQDIGSSYLSNTIEIPALFYPPLIWGLSWRLAIKYNPAQAELLKNEYEQSYNNADIENTESVPINIEVDYMGRGSYL